MGDYIEREAVIEEIEEWKDMYLDSDVAREALSLAKMSIKKLPAADARPVVRGYWEWNNCLGYYYCSNCKSISPRENQDGEYCDCPGFCHVCGADMRGKKDV